MRWEERCCKPNSGGDVKTLSAQDSGFATLGELVALLQDLAGVETRPPGCKRGLGLLIFLHFPRYQHHCFHVTSAAGLGSGRAMACRSGRIF